MASKRQIKRAKNVLEKYIVVVVLLILISILNIIDTQIATVSIQYEPLFNFKKYSKCPVG